MRIRAVFVASAVLATLVSCSSPETAQQQHHEANTVAGKMGQAAHRVSLAADKAGKVVGKELAHAAHDANEGWKEDAKRTKQRQ